MKYNFLGVDIPTITFTGISLPYERKIAVIATLGIWLGIVYGLINIALLAENVPVLEDIAFFMLVGVFFQICLGREIFLLTVSRWLVDYMPIGVLYRQDKFVIEQANSECLSISRQVSLEDYLTYSKINPSIRSPIYLAVFEHQRKGDLEDWVENTKNLKTLADLVYQFYLVESLLSVDMPSFAPE